VLGVAPVAVGVERQSVFDHGHAQGEKLGVVIAQVDVSPGVEGTGNPLASFKRYSRMQNISRARRCSRRPKRWEALPP
jgi:hypothetical protein